MDPTRLKRLEHLYPHSRYMGAATLLRRDRLVQVVLTPRERRAA